MGLSPLLFPLILMAICVVWFFNPLATPEGLFHRSSRYWLLRRCFYCFTAPLHMVTFADFWLGDQMNSLLTVFLDMQYFVCFYATEVDYNGWNVVARAHHSGVNDTIDSLHPVPWGYVDYTSGQDKCSTAAGLRSFVLIIPAAVRFLQCLRRYRDAPHFHPHLTNAGKYMTTFLVVGFGAANRWYVGRSPDISQFASPFFYLWILSYIISFTYTFLWDVFMDWGLCDPKAPKDMPYLRNEMIYGVKWYYYAAIVQDFVLRLLWVMNVSLGEAWTLEAELLLCVTSPLELIRRFIWNFLRLENEHVNNCGNFRAVRDISIKPIEFKGTLETLINKIDNDDAVTHRHDQLNGKQPKKKQRKTAAKRIISHMAHMPLLQHIHLSDHNLHKPWSKHSTSDLV
uniref:EXS domain-containing protein n=1 Tax=Plectus sambesii TaxID=2011161 RepID=A0A914XI11_9BILA